MNGLLMMKVFFRCREVVSGWVFAQMGAFGTGVLFAMLRRAVLAALTCIFALGGALVGTITGAITGQTTETGFFRGSAIGAVAGSVVALELLESVINGESSSKVALFGSLLNGKIFREWVGPAILKAYQWQISGLETSYRDISDIYDVDGTKGMSLNSIKKLPRFKFSSGKMSPPCSEICCAICLQEFKEGETARRLPSCRHFFHLSCIDGWLIRRGSCPICRKDV